VRVAAGGGRPELELGQAAGGMGLPARAAGMEYALWRLREPVRDRPVTPGSNGPSRRTAEFSPPATKLHSCMIEYRFKNSTLYVQNHTYSGYFLV
jgi:hypothetical protein